MSISMSWAVSFALFVVAGLLSAGLLIERKIHLRTVQKLSQCETQLKNTQENLSKYVELWKELKNKCELDKKTIQQKYSLLLRKAVEPTPQINIPHQTDECSALKEMIDEAIHLLSE